MDDIFLSVVIPCRDEEETIPFLKPSIQEFLKIKNTEIIFVDDGSKDKTRDLIKKYFPFSKVFIHKNPLGLSKALVTGTLNSKGMLIAWYDADSTYNARYIHEMIDVINKKGADVVTVSPWHRKGKAIYVPFIRCVGSKVISSIYRGLGFGSLSTYTALFRVHKRESLLEALPKRDGFIGVAESLLKFIVQNKVVVEIPAVLENRKKGFSKFRVLKGVLGHISLMYELCFRRFE